MGDFKERLFEELDELQERINELDNFSNSEEFGLMDEKRRELIKDQLSAMNRYLNILSLRIELLNDIEEAENRNQEYQGMCEEKQPINYAGSMSGY